MRRPSNYDSVEPQTMVGFSSPDAGGYTFRILKAEEKMSKKMVPMLVLSLDINEGEYKKYYSELSTKLNRDCLLKVYQLTEGEMVGRFKGIIKSIEESNPGYFFDFNEQTLVGKIVAGCLREEEYYHDATGAIKTSMKIAYLCSTQHIKDGNIKPLPPKKVDTSFSPAAFPQLRNNSPGNDDKLPWED